MHYYDVAPIKIIRATVSHFTYQSDMPLRPGHIVLIPVGKKMAVGIVLASAKKPAFETKNIDSLVDPTPLPGPLLTTALWLSDYYATPLATVLSSILPSGITKKRRPRSREQQALVRHHKKLSPTSNQQEVITAIQQSDAPTQLLHGVTGSGKTLIYSECVKRAYENGRSSIILVPEIALTPQLVDEFKNIFHDDVLVIHSLQTEAERHTTWLECLHATTPKIIIGPRSALFSPLASIGMVIIDEFHEPTYKQEQSPRYHATRVATILARHHHATALLGSATPSVNDYYVAEQSNAPIHTLTTRAISGASTPTITLVDMKKRINFTRHRFLSNQLLESIEASLASGKQTLLFHNRRGTAAITLCNNCGWSAVDPDTDLPLTLHADTHTLVSHITGFIMPVPTSCPVCKGVDIIHKGIGTKLLESEIKKIFPNKKVVRFDGDTSVQDSLHNHYEALYDGSIDIIIGTQVVAKGLDLPHLQTVGVIQADTGLVLPDYTADERTFQLLSQVIGRVGRTQLHSTVVVQSYQPDHLAVTTGLHQDYATFYHHAIATRRHHAFPPFTYVLKLTCVYKTEASAIKNSRALARQLKAQYPTATITGPAPAFYEKQHGTFRWQIIIKSKTRSQLQAIATSLPRNYWQYELDPFSLL